jgi:hypothetical protein
MRVLVLAAVAALAGGGMFAVPAPAADTTGCTTGDVVDATQPTAPTAVACTPVSGSSDVSNSVHPTVTFSRPMDGTTINRTSVTLTRDDGKVVLATVSYNQVTLTATIWPAYPLDYSRPYTARVATTVRSLDQQPLASPVTWSLTTSGVGLTKRVNVGGLAYLSPFSTAFYMADIPVSGSLTTSGGYNRTTGAVVSGTDDRALYADEKYGNFTENIIVPSGTYDVRLHFAETQGERAGKRVFNVDILETPGTDLPNLDIAATVGQNVALVKTISGVITTGAVIRIRTTALTYESPVLAAVEVLPATPRIASTSPGDTAAGVSPTSAVQATFSRGMDGSSISTKTFTLTGPFGAAVAASVTYDATARTASLVPNEQLAPGTTYTAQVDGAVRGSDGMVMGAPYSWTFTTNP